MSEAIGARFDEMDKDGNGVLTADELDAFFETIDIRPAQRRQLTRKILADFSGSDTADSITRGELLAYVHSRFWGE